MQKDVEKKTKKEKLNNKIIKLKKKYKDLHYTDSSVKPQLTEPNIEILLENNNIELKFNEVSKTITKIAMDNENLCKSDKLLTSFLEDEIVRENFQSKSYDGLYRKLDSIAFKNSYNPIKEYLYKNYQNNKSKISKEYKFLNEYISMLKVRPEEKELTELLVKRWLVSCVACHFDDNFVSHGVLTLKGEQGIGKTTWFRLLIPEYLKKENKEKDGYFKEGFTLDLSNKDKVIEFLQYWIVELGELDSTAKKQIDELKAFVTKKYDTFRSPFGRTNEDYKRRTVACASIDKDEFLRDDVNRRWWVIDCLDIDYQKKNNTDMLWAEVYDLCLKKERYYLDKSELELLNNHNTKFNMKTELDTLLISNFDWDSEERYYLRPKDIFLYLPSSNKITSSTIGRALKKLKVAFKDGRSRTRYYKMPKVFEHVISENLYKAWNFEKVYSENVEILDISDTLNRLKNINIKSCSDLDKKALKKEMARLNKEITLDELDVFSEKSKANQGKDLENIIVDNAEKNKNRKFENISVNNINKKEDKPSEEDEKCRDFIDNLTVLLKEHFGGFESSFEKYSSYLMILYDDKSKIKDFMPDYEDFINKWKIEADYKNSNEYKNKSDEDKKKWEKENSYKNTIDYDHKCHKLLEYLDNKFGKVEV